MNLHPDPQFDPLEAGNRSRAARISVRPMLESLFSLVAAGKDPTFSCEKDRCRTRMKLSGSKSGVRKITVMNFEASWTKRNSRFAIYV